MNRFFAFACCVLLAGLSFASDSGSVNSGESPKAQACSSAGVATACVDVNAPKRAADPGTGGASAQADITATRQRLTTGREAKTFGTNFLRDQKWFWTSPLRIREQDAPLLLPLALGTTILIGSDTAVERHLPTGQSTINRSTSLSNYGIAAFAGITAGAYFLGRARGNDYLRETGFLAAEAAASSIASTEVIKLAAGRNRPTEGDGRGRWLQGGSSFPSEHSSVAWSVATVVADRYPGWMTKFLAYGGAAGVSAARVSGRNHFLSDAVIGSALGWYMGRHVLTHASDADERKKEIARLGVFQRSTDDTKSTGHAVRSRRFMGSAYVPLDSWIYGAFDRLIGLGYIHSDFAGIRPWTRLECARLLAEAADQLLPPAAPGESGTGTSALPAGRTGSKNRREDEGHRIYETLNREFAVERQLIDNGGSNFSAKIETIYTRFTNISGQPLTDGYHFGQTVINDFGRPYQEGLNNVTGASARATAGPVVLYVRGEYQRAPSGPVLPLAARQFMAAADFGVPVPPGTPATSTSRFEVLDAYGGLNVANWQLTFGRQSLWWGPGLGGPMLFSNNAEPINMLRVNRVSPFKLPSILGWLGPIRLELFLGQLQGSQFVFSPSGLVGQWGQSLSPQPYIHGQKFNFKPTPNFEFGLSRTTIYGGPGYPFTLYTFGKSIVTAQNEAAGAANKPGDRRAGVDFTYRIPKLRNWLTFYGDGFTDDQFSPIAYADRSVWHAGLYLVRVPGIPKLDLRAEGVYSDNPLGGQIGPGYFYNNATWRSGYTNNGNLIGSWIGRAGQGGQAWATYHFTPRSDVQFNYRHQNVSKFYDGGTINDYGVRANFWYQNTVSVTAQVQYERWFYPLLASGPQSNVTTSIQLNYWPKGRVR